ncbi:tumor necrosis factor receptor superfamily member 21 isoform X2 [Rhinoderma darwinii]|uniref:tumor necrosis factor receptor superfamily member 21 isoform X2 n=1 Tax=Rhinoderma darwinii TaxID=43563 RepID=UPI003F66A1E4
MGATGEREGCSTRTSAAAGICLLAVLLFHLDTTGAEPVQFSDKKTITLPSGKYLYTNPVSKINVTCDKCPAGTYVSKHCTKFALRECSPCPNGTFTRHENGNDRCHNCTPPCEPPMVMKMPCSALSDRECSCPSVTYLLNGTCVNHTVCPVGWGVRKKGSETENVKCKTCAHGTYSDVPSSTLRCKTHTNCSALGMIVQKPGTNEQDNVCGPLSSSTSKDFYSPSVEYGIDILKLVAAQVGSQWQDIYQFLCNANEHEVAAFSNGYTADHERAYAALQHWTIRGPEASLAKLISALRQHRRNDVVEKIRGLMEDTVQIEDDKPTLQVNPNQPIPTQDPSLKGPDLAALTVEPSPLDKNKGFFADESEPLLRCDSTSSGSSALSRTGSFITKEKKDTVLRQVRLDPCDLQPIFDDLLPILSPEEIHIIDEIPQAEDKLDRLFEIAGVKSQEASQKLLDSVYSHLPDLL